MNFAWFFDNFLSCFKLRLNVDFVKVCVFLEENTYFHDFEVAEMTVFSLFLQPFLGIDFGTDFPSFLEAILVHCSNLLASFFDTFQTLICC